MTGNQKASWLVNFRDFPGKSGFGIRSISRSLIARNEFRHLLRCTRLALTIKIDFWRCSRCSPLWLTGERDETRAADEICLHEGVVRGPDLPLLDPSNLECDLDEGKGRRLTQCSPHQDVVEIVTVKALWNHSEPQLSIICPQRIQSKIVILTQFQQVSTSRRIWFGTRGSEVQILSPRPLKSTTYKLARPAPWYRPRCPTAGECVNIGFLVHFRMQSQLQEPREFG
jgi:hypothetical protein